MRRGRGRQGSEFDKGKGEMGIYRQWGRMEYKQQGFFFALAVIVDGLG